VIFRSSPAAEQIPTQFNYLNQSFDLMDYFVFFINTRYRVGAASRCFTALMKKGAAILTMPNEEPSLFGQD
jgi:hypothetical protein